MTDLPKCRICKCNYVSRPFANDYVFACSNNGCFMSAHEFTYAEWAALMGRGEPVAWMYLVNGVHIDFSTIEPPDDAYDAGTLVPLYTQAPAVDGAVIREAIRTMDDGERLDIFSEYCRCCGSNDPTCQCWNDE